MKDFDLTRLPDELLPEITELPGQLQDVARVIGVRPALLLEKRFRGTYIYCYKADALRRRLRDKWIRVEYDRMLRAGVKKKTARLALETGLSERQVWNILGRVDEDENDSQGRLW
jgi:hypothetical protein